MVSKIKILSGNDKSAEPEKIKSLEIEKGEILAVVGPTGSGKTQLISDIEQYAQCDTPSKRQVLINNIAALNYDNCAPIRHLTAEVSQNMNFVIDMSVGEFLMMHAEIREISEPRKIVEKVIEATNELAGEPISGEDNVTVLSGGQSRALMVADVALISNAPIVLIDEIENAGISRTQAMDFLAKQGKVVIIVTHDPMLSLMADRRIVMKNGGMFRLQKTTPKEKMILRQLMDIDQKMSFIRDDIRAGENIDHKILLGGVTA